MGVRRREGDEPWRGFVPLWRMQPAPQGTENMAVLCGSVSPGSRIPAVREMPREGGLQLGNTRHCLEKGESKSNMVERFSSVCSGLGCFCCLLVVGKGISLGLAGWGFLHCPGEW